MPNTRFLGSRTLKDRSQMKYAEILDAWCFSQPALRKPGSEALIGQYVANCWFGWLCEVEKFSEFEGGCKRANHKLREVFLSPNSLLSNRLRSLDCG